MSRILTVLVLVVVVSGLAGSTVADRVSLSGAYSLTPPAVRRAFLPLVLIDSVTTCNLPAPAMLAPSDGENVNTLIPQLRIRRTPGTGLTTTIKVDDSADLLSPRATFHIRGGGAADYATRLDTNLQPAIRYYWQAVDACGEVQGPLGARWTFNTPASGVILPAPVLTAPVSGTVAGASALALQWQPLPGAVEYRATVRVLGTNSWRAY